MNWREIDGYWHEGDAKFYEAMVKRFGDRSRFCEIGSYKGRSTVSLLEAIKLSGKEIDVFCVDTWEGSEEHQGLPDVDKLFEIFLSNIKDYPNIDTYKMTSLDGAGMFADGRLDFVFIDAAHDYDSVVSDIQAWLPKVRAGGVLAGHDIQHPPVQEALKFTLGNKKIQTGMGLCWWMEV